MSDFAVYSPPVGIDATTNSNAKQFRFYEFTDVALLRAVLTTGTHVTESEKAEANYKEFLANFFPFTEFKGE